MATPTKRKGKKKKSGTKPPDPFLSADIGIVLEKLGNDYLRGPELVNQLRADGIRTIGDLDERATGRKVPYMKILTEAGLDAVNASDIVDAIKAISDDLAGKNIPPETEDDDDDDGGDDFEVSEETPSDAEKVPSDGVSDVQADNPTKNGDDAGDEAVGAVKAILTPEQTEKLAAFDRAASLEEAIRNKEAEVQGLQEDLKTAKKELEALESQLKGTIHDAKNPQETPLYPSASTSQNGDGKATPQSAEDNSWQAVPLSEALPDLTKGLLQKLTENNLTTMGELAAWTAADQGKHQITDIPGVGPAAATKIEEACTAFWEQRKRVLPFPASAVAPEPAPEEAVSDAAESTSSSSPAIPSSSSAKDTFQAMPIREVLFGRVTWGGHGREGEIVDALESCRLTTVGVIAGRSENKGQTFQEVIIGGAGFTADEAQKICDAIGVAEQEFFGV